MAHYEQVIIDQASPGTTTLRAAEPHYGIDVINYVVVLDADGTFAFSDGTDWMSGDMPVAAKGGVSAKGSKEEPLMLPGATGRPLQITTVGGSAHGHALIRLR